MAIKMDNYGNVYNDELFHYGKKGMKWGKHVMAQEKYWITGNGRNLGTGGNSGGFQDVNSRMRNDTSGIKWKPSVSANVNNPRVRGASAASIWSKRGVGLGTSRDSVNVGKTKSNINPRYYSNTPSAWMNKNGQNKVLNSAKNRSNKVVPTSNPAIKGVNTGAKGVPYGTGGLSVNPNVKTSRVKQVVASNTFRSSVQKKASNALKTGISAVGQKPDKIKKAKKKAAVGILKLASKLMKWF